jgi:hypothetical protein
MFGTYRNELSKSSKNKSACAGFSRENLEIAKVGAISDQLSMLFMGRACKFVGTTLIAINRSEKFGSD